jgi:hypothetical protein
MNGKGLDKLGELISSKIELLVQNESEKLRIAGEQGKYFTKLVRGKAEDMQLSVILGLLKKDHEEPGLYDKICYYSLTEEGRKMYELIYGNKKI